MIPETSFIMAHPYIAGFVILVLGSILIYCVTYAVSYTICFLTRHKTIREKGYPPAHCDADGDPIGKKKEEL